METVDADKKLRYKQVWDNNMTVCHSPVVESVEENTSSYTKITFSPDLAKFYPEMSTKAIDKHIKDILVLFKRRAYDIAACVPNVQVVFNDSKLPIKNFNDYLKLFAIHDKSSSQTDENKKEGRHQIFYCKVSDRWEVGNQ